MKILKKENYEWRFEDDKKRVIGFFDNGECTLPHGGKIITLGDDCLFDSLIKRGWSESFQK